MDGEGTATGGEKMRDYVGMLQDCFQGMLQQMTDLLGRIQRDAAIDPSTDPGYVLFKYEEIPEAAKMLVHQVMVIDAIIDEAAEKTDIEQMLSSFSALTRHQEGKNKSFFMKIKKSIAFSVK